MLWVGFPGARTAVDAVAATDGIQPLPVRYRGVEASRAGPGGVEGMVCGWTSLLRWRWRMDGANDDVSRETESQHAEIAAADVEESASTRGIRDSEPLQLTTPGLAAPAGSCDVHDEEE